MLHQVTYNVVAKQQKKGVKKQDKVRVVQCGCTTIDSWAIEEWDNYQQHLSKEKKKGGKKRKRKTNNVRM